VKRLRVGVIYGGRSGEHEVSLASAAAVFANLDRQRYEPVAIRIEKDGRWVLADRPPTASSAADVILQAQSDATRVRGGKEVFLPARPGGDTLLLVDRQKGHDNGNDVEIRSLTALTLDVVFPVLHGPYGEDGTLQGLLELAGVPFVGCGVLASAVSMDKAVMKSLFAARGLRVSPWIALPRREWLERPEAVRDRLAGALSYPLFVKPANLGSSVGVSKVHDRSELDAAMALAAEFDRKIVVEAAVPNAREIECGVLGNETPAASRPGEIVPSNEFYDYEAKYVSGRSRAIIPAELDEAVAREVQRQAVVAFQAVEGAGMARVDFLLNGQTGELFVNEVNTIPGFTTISMFPQMWGASGLDYPALVDRLIALAIERHADAQTLRTDLF
jgi:D-alanine-D-alanine ligase